MDNLEQQRSINVQGLNRFLSRMYGYMAGAIAVSALTAFLTVRYLADSIFNNPMMMLILGIVSIGMVFSLSFNPNRSAVSSTLMLFGYAAIEGILFSSILAVYTMKDITMAFVSAAIVFVILSVFGLNTKKDLSRIGQQAIAALFALIIVSIINLFLQSSAIEYVFSYVGVIIFTILTAWDTQQMKDIYLQYGNQVNANSLAVSGALQLYLDFINMFLNLIQIFGQGDSRD